MWVVHSLNPEIDLKPDDIRLRLIKHALDPNAQEEEQRLSAAESPFEKDVMSFLINKGYSVVPQVKVGFYRIDMVIEDGEKRIALECDGEKWHTQDDLPNDLKRQAILERMGWTFIRIRGSAFYSDPEAIMKEVFDKLETYGLHPNYSLDIQPDIKDDELIERVKRRANEIRQVWHIGEGEDVNEVNAERKIFKKDFKEVEESIEGAMCSDYSEPLFEGLEKMIDISGVDSSKLLAKESNASIKKSNDIRQMDIDDLLLEMENDSQLVLDFRKPAINQQSKSPVKLKDNKPGNQIKTEKTTDKQKPLFDFRKRNGNN